MAARTVPVLVLVLLPVLAVQRSECVRCFAHFNLTSGVCDEELGDVVLETCCQNPTYGYLATDGECQFCGPPVWAPWSSWSFCNVLCGDGVRQRSRKCFSFSQSECSDTVDTLQIEPCNGTCCDDRGWSSWRPWSSCSVSCEGRGVRRRVRVCSSRPECLSSCSGPSEETRTCEARDTCPVHGAWSSWSGWSSCSAPCLDDRNRDVLVPTRQRRRSCSDPIPSSGGDNCPGGDVQMQDCSELPNCPVDGGWGAWPPPGPCSVSCGAGLQLTVRKCDTPPPKHGGRYCDGQSSQTRVCDSPCPVDGFWSGWTVWTECSSPCVSPAQPSTRSRRRSCTNPAPSASPPGNSCQGGDSQTEDCVHLPPCPVDGSWGVWSAWTSCSVTCGAGLRVSIRLCDNPASNHGGQPCPGDERRTVICSTGVHCPVDGSWSAWGPWDQCRNPFFQKGISCKLAFGRQKRERFCRYQAHGGSICKGLEQLTERRSCFDVHRCRMTGRWVGWGPWTSCWPTCGNSERVRRRICEPDYSKYSEEQGRQQEDIIFSGKPLVDCGAPPEGGKAQTQPCVSLPPCT